MLILPVFEAINTHFVVRLQILHLYHKYHNVLIHTAPIESFIPFDSKKKIFIRQRRFEPV